MYITYNKKFIKIGQVWFEDEIKFDDINEKIDMAYFHGILQKKSYSNTVFQKFHTLITDLTEEEDSLYALINKNVKYEIRKNTGEDVELRTFWGKEILDNNKVMQDLGEMYRLMYKSKGMDASFNYIQAEEYAKKDALLITGIYKNGQPLVFHSYIINDTHARLLHSVSDFRDIKEEANLIARSNKRLHWDDIRMLKQKGIKVYDWGGISDFDNPNGIDLFKMKFGGKQLSYYNAIVGRSFIGKIGVLLLKLKG